MIRRSLLGLIGLAPLARACGPTEAPAATVSPPRGTVYSTTRGGVLRAERGPLHLSCTRIDDHAILHLEVEPGPWLSEGFVLALESAEAEVAAWSGPLLGDGSVSLVASLSAPSQASLALRGLLRSRAGADLSVRLVAPPRRRAAGRVRSPGAASLRS